MNTQSFVPRMPPIELPEHLDPHVVLLPCSFLGVPYTMVMIDTNAIVRPPKGPLARVGSVAHIDIIMNALREARSQYGFASLGFLVIGPL